MIESLNTPFRILVGTSYGTLELNPLLIPGMPQAIPLAMEEVVRSLGAASKEDLLNSLIDGTVPTPESPFHCAANRNVEAIKALIQEKGLGEVVSYRVIPMTSLGQPEQGPWTAIADNGGSPLVYSGVVSKAIIKLRTLAIEAQEACAALEAHYNAATPNAERPSYIEVPRPIAEELLRLIRITPSSNVKDGEFSVHDVLPLDVRHGLQVITSGLTELRRGDGLGHTLQDSTTMGLLAENDGAEQGDRHEQMVNEAFGVTADSPRIEKPAVAGPEVTE